MNPILTPEQYERMKPYERFFTQAVNAAYTSYPGQASIDAVLDTWKEVTGHAYPYKRGCGHCRTNLYRDMGTLYFAAKAAAEDAEAEKAVEPAQTTTEKKKPARGKKK